MIDLRDNPAPYNPEIPTDNRPWSSDDVKWPSFSFNDSAAALYKLRGTRADIHWQFDAGIPHSLDDFKQLIKFPENTLVMISPVGYMMVQGRAEGVIVADALKALTGNKHNYRYLVEIPHPFDDEVVAPALDWLAESGACLLYDGTGGDHGNFAETIFKKSEFGIAKNRYGERHAYTGVVPADLCLASATLNHYAFVRENMNMFRLSVYSQAVDVPDAVFEHRSLFWSIISKRDYIRFGEEYDDNDFVFSGQYTSLDGYATRYLDVNTLCWPFLNDDEKALVDEMDEKMKEMFYDKDHTDIERAISARPSVAVERLDQNPEYSKYAAVTSKMLWALKIWEKYLIQETENAVPVSVKDTAQSAIPKVSQFLNVDKAAQAMRAGVPIEDIIGSNTLD